jgi:hypothetical protein
MSGRPRTGSRSTGAPRICAPGRWARTARSGRRRPSDAGMGAGARRVRTGPAGAARRLARRGPHERCSRLRHGRQRGRAGSRRPTAPSPAGPLAPGLARRPLRRPAPLGPHPARPQAGQPRRRDARRGDADRRLPRHSAGFRRRALPARHPHQMGPDQRREVVSFRTFMTGELFALLAERSVLRHGLGEGWTTRPSKRRSRPPSPAPKPSPRALPHPRRRPAARPSPDAAAPAFRAF